MKKLRSILLSLSLLIVLILGVTACQTPPPAKYYEVYFETSGYCEVETQYVKENETATRPTPDPENATREFGGWYTDTTFTTEFDFSTPITQNIDIYAKWTKKESTYTVTFDTNGRGRAPVNQYIEAGTNGKINKPADLTANGYRFLGWSLDKDGGRGLLDFDEYIPTSSVTVYAQWIQVVTVSFDLNNKEALIAPPTNQSVDVGSVAVVPSDPFVTGYIFDGWYEDAACEKEFDFATPITARTTLYAKWIDNTVKFIDGSDLPDYEWEKNAAYGERPDLDGYLIDGEIGEKEAWSTQTYYVNAISDAPTVTMQVTTVFSEKGLYVFGKAKDNGGIYWTGINYHFKNTSWTFYIMGENVTSYNVFEVPKVEIDTRNVFPSWVNVKGASKVVAGEINSTNNDNKYAEMNVEFFITWQDLRIDASDGIPEKVFIYPSYNYKRLEGANFTYNLLPTFTNTGKSIDQKLNQFLEFNANGFADLSDEDSIFGDSSYGIAKSRGWDIENNEATSLETGDRVVFFKDVTGSYYQFSTEIMLTGDITTTGNAGVTIFNSETNYTSLRFDINNKVYEQGVGFLIARPKIFTTNKDGALERILLDDIPIADGKLRIKTVFSNGYVFYIVNDKLINCQLVTSLNERTNPGLMTYNVAGVKFINNSVEVLDANSARDKISEFAYIITKGKTENITMSFDTVGVTNESDNKLTIYYQNSRLGISNSQKTKIWENSDFSGVALKQIESVKMTTDGITTDITEDFRQNAGYGQYVVRGITGDTEFSTTSSNVPLENLVFKQFKIFDDITKESISTTATASITSSNPMVGDYEMIITGANAVLVLVKGYDYKITVKATGYRDYHFDLFENVTENESREPIYMIPNIVGGTAVDKEGKMMFVSSTASWDMSTESLGYISMETTNTNFSSVYFSGVTVDNYQVVEMQVANTTNTGLNSNYEANPGAGFMFVDSRNKYSWIELAGNRIRVLNSNTGWSPDYYNIPGSLGTVNVLPSDPDDPETFYYTKFTVIKIDSMCYCYVNDEFVIAVELYNLEGKCGVALAGHSSYYLSMRYKEYWIKTGNDALEYALDKIAVVPVLDESCYDLDDNYDTDYTKPYVKFDGLITVGEGDNKQEVSFIGQNITVSLTEYAIPSIAYTVNIGSKKIVLTQINPTAEISLGYNDAGDLAVKVIQSYAYTVSGTVYKDDGSAASGAQCSATSEDGSLTVYFTAGEDGTFIVGVPKGTFVINVKLDGYVSQKSALNIASNVSDYTIQLLKSPIGGKVNGGSQSSSDGLEMGYNYSDASTTVSGIYGLVTTRKDVQYAFNEGLMKDFVVEYSYVRKEVEGVVNESNPAVGIVVYTNGLKEALTFFTGAVRIIPSGGTWEDRVNVGGRGDYNLQKYNEQTDFKIMRRKNVYYMYYKYPNETNYHLTYVYESLGEDAASEVFLQNTCATSNSFLVFNIKVTRFDDGSLPDDVIYDVKINNVTPQLGSATLSGGTQTGNGTVYALGDTVTVNFEPNDGYSVAYVKVNGTLVGIRGNKYTFTVANDVTTIECGFEVTPIPVAVKGNVIIDGSNAGAGVTVEAVNALNVVVNTATTANDGSFEMTVNSGSYTLRPNVSGYACENKRVELQSDLSGITLVCKKAILSGEVTGATIKQGYNYADDKLTIDGVYAEIESSANVQYAFDGVYGDFVLDFSHVRREVPNVTNESNPGVGIIVNGGESEHISYYANAIRYIPAGGTWNDRVNVTNLGATYNVQLYDNQIDFRIVRKNNVYFMFYKKPTESNYSLAYRYASESGFEDVSVRMWYSTSYPVHFFLFNMQIRAIGANEFTDLT